MVPVLSTGCRTLPTTLLLWQCRQNLPDENRYFESPALRPHSAFHQVTASGLPKFFFFEGASKNSVEDREQSIRGSGVGGPLARCSGGSCNLVQKISFHIVNVLNFWYFRLYMMTANLFFIANVKQLRTSSFRILLPSFRISWCVGFLIFNF
jgi:hypothetical protein